MTRSERDVQDLVHHIDRALDDLERLARESSSQEEFFSQLTKTTAAVTSAMSVYLLRSGHGRLLPLAKVQAGSGETTVQWDDPSVSSVATMALKSGQPACSEAGTASLIAAPILAGQEPWGVVVTVHQENLPTHVTQGCQEFLTAVCEAAADFLRGVGNLSAGDFPSLLALATNVHSSLQVKEVAEHLASDAREVLKADRVWVAERRGKRCRLLTSSGLEDVNAQSPTVKTLARLISVVIRHDAAFWIHGKPEDAPSEVREPLQEFLQQSSSTSSVGIIPLQPRPARGSEFALVIEHMQPPDQALLAARTDQVVALAESALRNACKYESVPLRGLAGCTPANWNRCFRPGTVVALLLFCGGWGLLAYGALAKGELEISVRGRLTPKIERRIFSPVDGQIKSISVHHDSQVEQGDEIVVLESPDLELEIRGIVGEIETAQQKLESLQIAVNQINPSTQQDLLSQSRMAGEIKELQLKLSHLQGIRTLLDDRAKTLSVTSPIGGVVTTWNLTEHLHNRPVKSGDLMLTVADLSGPWHLKLSIPEHQSGHVLKAIRAAEQEAPKLEYCLATHPEKKYTAHVTQASLEAQVQGVDDPYIEFIAEFAGEQPELHSGSTVVGQIHCGRQLLLYIWFREVIEAAQRRFWW